jgi:excisionase family DNA binding protein
MEDNLHAFTFDEVAGRLGVSRSTVERMTRAGHLRTVSVWGRPRVTAAELRRYLERLQGAASAERPRLRAVRHR